MRWLAYWVIVVASGLLPAAEGFAQSPASEQAVRQLIASWGELTPPEQHALLPWLFTAIGQQPDPRVRRMLVQDLDLKRSSRPADAQVSIVPMEATQTVQARQSFEQLLKQRRDRRLPESAIRERIQALMLDPAQPEIGLAQGMELAGAIDQIEDQATREALRQLLEDRLALLQEGLPEL